MYSLYSQYSLSEGYIGSEEEDVSGLRAATVARQPDKYEWLEQHFTHENIVGAVDQVVVLLPQPMENEVLAVYKQDVNGTTTLHRPIRMLFDEATGVRYLVDGAHAWYSHFHTEINFDGDQSV